MIGRVQLGSRRLSQLVVECVASEMERAHRLGLAPATIEREHRADAPSSSFSGCRPSQTLQLGDDIGMPAAFQVGGDALPRANSR